MRVKLLFAIAIIALTVASCQKELSFDDNGGSGGGGGGGGTTGDLLAKVVSASGGETVISEYEYDANKRLIREKVSGNMQGQNIGDDYRIVRNASGIITKTIQKNQDLILQGIDSAVAVIHYNAATQQYQSRVADLSFFGLSTIDSTVFIYDGSGKLIRSDDFISNAALGPDYVLFAVTDFSYSASGVTETRFSVGDPANPGGAPELAGKVNYEYDSKTSPLILPNGEAAAILRMDLVAVANATRYTYTDVINAGANNFDVTYVYTYNSNNKPVSSVSTENPGNIVWNITYTYK